MNTSEKFYDNYLSKNPRNFEKYALLDFTSIYHSFESYYAKFLPIDKEAKMVDLGCGSGAFVSWLQSKGYKNVEGIDISKEQIDAGIKHGVQDLRRADVFEYFDDYKEAFALISAHDVMEHFKKDKILSLLTLIFEALQPAGVVLISTANAESIFSARIRYFDFTHEVAFTPHSLMQVLHFVGFEDVKIFPKVPCIHGLKSAVRWSLWKIIEHFIKFYLMVETGSTGNGVYTQVMYAVGRKK